MAACVANVIYWIGCGAAALWLIVVSMALLGSTSVTFDRATVLIWGMPPLLFWLLWRGLRSAAICQPCASLGPCDWQHPARLATFCARLDRCDAPFMVPEIIESGVCDGVAYAVEARVSGIDLAKALGRMEGRGAVLRDYSLVVVVQVQGSDLI
jgi:hypothetical protein